MKIRLPKQIKVSADIVRSWTSSHPSFYGERATNGFVKALVDTEEQLLDGGDFPYNPRLCRVLAAYHGPKGAKVPLCASTTSGCVRPIFVHLNDWLKPGMMSCYDGGCYLFHARAVPAKRAHEVKVRAHTTPVVGLLAAARISRLFGLPIRDNQSSDGSLSMSLYAKNGNQSQLVKNLSILNEQGYNDVPYLCFSSAYAKVSNDTLKTLSCFPNLVVHITVSGWHSKEENYLRLEEFERYSNWIKNVRLRVVNRQDWAIIDADDQLNDHAARCENWLIGRIIKLGLSDRVIRTPFHSVHPFPGSKIGNLGSRHMASAEYSVLWNQLIMKGAQECCITGKCKTCETRCGTIEFMQKRQNPLIAARAFESMLSFELRRHKTEGVIPLAAYTTRILAKKTNLQYKEAGIFRKANEFLDLYEHWNYKCKKLDLTSLERKRLSNDCHALVIDGLDKHGLWRTIKLSKKKSYAS